MPLIEPERLGRYDRPGRRYTSYPSAPHFDERCGETQLREAAAASNGDLRGALAALERDLIARAIRDHHGNLAAAGRALGIERNLLYYKLRKYGFRT